MLKKGTKRALAMLLSLSMIFGGTNFKALAENNRSQNTQTASVSANDGMQSSSNWDGITKESGYEGNGFDITFKLQDYWSGGFNANVKIVNTGDTTIENWALGFDYQGGIASVWDAVLDSSEPGEYIVKNAGWNQDIAAGQSIEFGINGQGDFTGFPSEYQLIGQISDLDTDDYDVNYVLTSDWGSGFAANITINNNMDQDIEDWVLEFDFNREITNIWNGVIEKHEGNHYVIRNAGYNSNIALGQCIAFGFNGCKGESGDEPNDYQLYSSKLMLKDNDDEIDETLDSENDGVPDYLEDYFGTRKDKADTDDDGLSDYIEIFKIGTDPTVVDTDGNGINDGDEDTDQDGLTNVYEVEIGTDLTKPDTDSDGLSDSEEINTYKTNPLEYDTDQDGVSDGKEIELGTNPLIADELFFVTASANDEDAVEVSVEISLRGTQVESLSVERFENQLFFPETMPGYVGGAYDFHVDEDFDKATLKFKFDENLLVDLAFDPVIYYFNEESQLLQELDTKVEGNVASTEVTHFSKYILINRKVFAESFEWEDVWSSTGYAGVEVVLVIDDSGSMTSTDRNNERLNVAKNLIDNLPESSKMGLIKFANTTTKLTTGVTTDKERVKAYLTTGNFRSSGGTNMYNAISSAFSLFGSNDENIMKMMVVLSDGETADISYHSSVVTKANDMGVKIYTVGLGSSSSSYFTRYLKPLASNTAGAFYLASDASKLKEIYKDINKKIDIETDSDKDGIADYYEDNMVMFNGVKIMLDKNNPDSDGDGLTDGKEVAELNYKYNSDKTKVIVTGKLISNPLESDSDYDGKLDSTDKAPLNNHFTGVLTTDYATSEVEFEMNYQWFFNDNSTYCEDLGVTSSLFASAIYHPNSLSIKDSEKKETTAGTSMNDVLDYFGMNNTKAVELEYTYNDFHLSEVGLGYRTVSYKGAEKNIIAVIVRGTNGTIEEWSSNFEIGNLTNYDSESDWENSDNHMGFDIAANRIIDIVSQYVSDNHLNSKDCAYWITGHSRGAAIANIIGAYYESAQKTAYTYTFAAPNTTVDENASSYQTIFNVVNADDFVPCLPMEAWGYTKYGKTVSVSLAANYEKSWEELTGIRDYNPDTYGMQKTVNELGGIISSGDAREEAYKYTCSCHGDNSNDTITVTNYGTTENSRERAIAKIPSNALPYCKITRYDGWWVGGWNFDNCQTPAYFMQLLAANMSGKITNRQFIAELNIADRYESAKLAIAGSAVGGLKHPHYTESYYILAKNVTNGVFK